MKLKYQSIKKSIKIPKEISFTKGLTLMVLKGFLILLSKGFKRVVVK